MKILTWNIQATRGCDNNFDLSRIVDQIRKYGDLDVICLQEISRNIPDLNADDQPLLINQHFPDYEMIWGPGFSAPGTTGCRIEFGNLTLVKRGLLKNSHLHRLPGPPVQAMQMPRTMVETVITTGKQVVTIFNTHLAFHSESERVAQIDALTDLRDQIIAKSNLPELDNPVGPYRFANSCNSVILCGDLNIDSQSDVFVRNVIDRRWIDCWYVNETRDSHKSRDPTCGCYDDVQWPQGPHVRDYFLVSENIAEKTVNIEVDVETNASDHQPVFLEISL